MTEKTWRRGQKADYTDRPLTAEERVFAEEHHDYLYQFMRWNHLPVEDWYDELVIPYLNAVKKYCSREELHIYPFYAVAEKVLSRAVYGKHRADHTQKRMPKGGFVSLDYELEGDNPFAEYRVEDWWIDKKINVERQVILRELFQEFYNKCIYCDSDAWGDDHINDYLKCELDLLLKGHTRRQTNKETEKIFNNGYSVKDLDFDLKEFRKIFKEVFGI